MNEYYVYQVLYNQYLIMELMSQWMMTPSKARKEFLKQVRETKEFCGNQIKEILKYENDGFTRSKETADS